ncbi:hypothetical protein MNEG_11354 [Monoraphidium neglectum]|uniref:ATPase AAA-type core domain-containing protein n=1 Tax=Monoraphidium neglectum TaxID=145388 RepID=A0A0D2LZ09_9CHLO|nr:hypothetical protein MNEG_11354 [Monoraphidium neglectum]KIY96609.1 hypothetical protein MNEG_11354 [Monoraphidium neglectum]|eukprot:XP_013895629.1 hypothetical protein MNEG_11354 [Monoraphidium neglectum]
MLSSYDEVDAFLTKRGGASEHEATLSAKTEFMQLWDGIEGARGMRVLVMGATNRRVATEEALRSPWCIDEAVLRRFGLQYEVGLPGAPQRRQILLKHLARHEAESRALRAAQLLAPGEGGVEAALLQDRPSAVPGSRPGEGALSAVVRATEGYSGSDLTEVCAQAAQDVLAEKWAQEEADASQPGARPGAPARMRQLRGSDLLAALQLVKPSTARAGAYAAGLSDGGSGGGGGDDAPLQWLMAAAGAMSAAAAADGGAAGRRGGAGGDGGGGEGPSGAAGGGGTTPSDEQLKALGLLLLKSIRGSAGAGAAS